MNWINFKRLGALFLLMAAISACGAPAAAAVIPTPTQALIQPTSTSTTSPTFTAEPPTATPTAEPPTATPLPPFEVCSPLDGLTLETLPDVLSNPYNPPDVIGTDDGHHGVDFGYYRYGDRITMAGLPVFSALDGQVAMVTDVRYPYGYALLIETPLENLPDSFLQSLQLPPKDPLWTMDIRLYCPAPAAPPTWDESRRSLYILYGHFEQKAIVEPGQTVKCGQQVGNVGTTGLSLNEHLHFEVRVGPSGARFDSMDHYDNAAQDFEMWNYCLWRTSGHFKLVDPMLVLKSKSE